MKHSVAETLLKGQRRRSEVHLRLHLAWQLETILFLRTHDARVEDQQECRRPAFCVYQKEVTILWLSSHFYISGWITFLLYLSPPCRGMAGIALHCIAGIQNCILPKSAPFCGMGVWPWMQRKQRTFSTVASDGYEMLWNTTTCSGTQSCTAMWYLNSVKPIGRFPVPFSWNPSSSNWAPA